MSEKRLDVFLDIETVPKDMKVELPVKPTLEDMKVGNVKKENQAKAREDKLEDALIKWEKECDIVKEKVAKEHSLNPLKGEIICLCYKTPNSDVVTLRGEEKFILEQFQEMLRRSNGNFQLIAHNGKEFDFN